MKAQSIAVGFLAALAVATAAEFNHRPLRTLQVSAKRVQCWVPMPEESLTGCFGVEVYFSPSLTGGWQLVHSKVCRGDSPDSLCKVDFERNDREDGYYRMDAVVGEEVDARVEAETELPESGEELDSDGDGLYDAWEILAGLDPNDPQDAQDDYDGDGLDNGREFLYGTDMWKADSDGDGLFDGEEVYWYHTLPLNGDTDGDGLSDGWELGQSMDPCDATDAAQDNDGDGLINEAEFRWGTDPHVADTDGDGLLDGDEVSKYGTDPLRSDTDGDGISDGQEVRFGLDPNTAEDGGLDLDGDGLSNRQELELGTDPLNADSDGDRLSDGREVELGCNPLSAHSLRSDMCDGMAVVLGDHDWPFAISKGSDYTLWELAFYSGGTNGTVTLPKSSDSTAVLAVRVTGSGSGELRIGQEVVPLLAPAGEAMTLCQSVAKGKRQEVTVRVEGDLDVQLDSGDFCFGKMPTATDASGWIVFPNTATSVPCIHDYRACLREVSLTPGADAEELMCRWSSNDEKLSVEATGVRSAVISGEFPPRTLSPVDYELSHPRYLFGNCRYVQRVKFCPHGVDDEDEEDDEESGEMPYGDGTDAACWCGFCTFDNCLCSCHQEEEEWQEPEAEDEAESAEQYEQALALPETDAVLKLRNPRAYSSIAVTVPAGGKACCECPEHQGRAVSLIYSSKRLEVLDAQGMPVEGLSASGAIRVAGLQPSATIGDSRLDLCRNGEVYATHRYTVLGMSIASPQFQFDDFNDAAPRFGVPIGVETAPESGLQLSLRTEVGLSTGNVRLSLKPDAGRMQLWMRANTGEWELVLDSARTRQRTWSISQWRESAVRQAAEGGEGLRLVGVATGAVELEFGFAAVSGGRAVKDVARQRFTVVAPRLVFDWNRDGVIDECDRKIKDRTFRFWVNDDGDEGESAASTVSDAPAESGNAADDRVNGLTDILDFTPVKIDRSDFFADGATSALRDLLVWRLKSDCVRAVWTSLTDEEAGGFQRRDLGASFGSGLSQPLEEAASVALADSVFPDSRFQRLLKGDEQAGVALLEGIRSGEGLTLEGCVVLGGQTNTLLTVTAPLQISQVEDMYRWLCLRSAAGDGGGRSSQLNEPGNRPDGECDGRHFVFVHGYNVNLQEAMGWASEMFKRLWQSGSEAMFTAVDWYGDESQVRSGVPLLGGNALDYYVNVEHAFATAAALSAACARLPGSKIMLGHSLGNVIVAAAAADHDLAYSRYYLLNAAVAAEAFDRRMADDLMVDGAWKDVPAWLRSSRFSELFAGAEYADDFRRGLSWKGRFANLPRTVNCFSSSEEVLANPEATSFCGVETENFGGAWAQQELFKGCTVWYGINVLTLSGVASEGGWGINARWVANPLAYVPLKGLKPGYFEDYTPQAAMENPLFTSFSDRRLHSADPLRMQDASLRAKLLADGIPAESFAAGANEIEGVGENLALESLMANVDSWPRRDGARAVWYHSDLKNLAYFHTYGLFDELVEGAQR